MNGGPCGLLGRLLVSLRALHADAAVLGADGAHSLPVGQSDRRGVDLRGGGIPGIGPVGGIHSNDTV